MADTKENTISLEDNHDGQDEKNSEDEEEEVVVRTPKELYEALLKASRDGDESCAREVFGEGGLEPSYVLEDMERHRNKGTWIPKWDPLTTAVVSGQTGLVNLLLERGYGDLWKPLSDSKMGSTTPLHWASCKGHLYILCDLLEFFGTDDVNSRDADGNCCLHLAASGGFGKSIEILLTAGADPTMKNSHGNTPEDLCTDVTCKSILSRSVEQFRTGQIARRSGLLSVRTFNHIFSSK